MLEVAREPESLEVLAHEELVGVGVEAVEADDPGVDAGCGMAQQRPVAEAVAGAGVVEALESGDAQ